MIKQKALWLYTVPRIQMLRFFCSSLVIEEWLIKYTFIPSKIFDMGHFEMS